MRKPLCLQGSKFNYSFANKEHHDDLPHASISSTFFDN
jgi:hypothetical protein